MSAAVQMSFQQEYEGVSLEQLFAFFENHNNLTKVFPLWFYRIKDSKDPRSPNAVGSVRLLLPVFITQEVLEYEPNHKIVYTTNVGPIKNQHAVMLFSSTEKGAQLNYDIIFYEKIPKSGKYLRKILYPTIQQQLVQSEAIVKQQV